MAKPKKLSDVILTGFVCLMIGYGTGTVLTERKKMVTLEHSLMLKWSDGVFDDPPLGAHVFLEPHMNGKSVRLRVYIGRDQPQFYMFGRIGELDVTDTAEEAAAKWGKLRWETNGLHIGVNGNRTRRFIPRAQILPITQ